MAESNINQEKDPIYDNNLFSKAAGYALKTLAAGLVAFNLNASSQDTAASAGFLSELTVTKDGRKVIELNEGNRKAYHLGEIVEGYVPGKKYAIAYPGEGEKKKEVVVDKSFDAFIERILEEKKKKDQYDFAKPEEIVVLDGDTLRINGLYSSADEAVNPRIVDGISIYSDNGKDTKLDVLVTDSGRRSDALKERETVLSLKSKEVIERGKRARQKMLAEGTYDRTAKYDRIDEVLADSIVYELAQSYKSGKREDVLHILEVLPAAKTVLAKKDGANNSSYQDLSKIVEEARKFEGYGSFLRNNGELRKVISAGLQKKERKGRKDRKAEDINLESTVLGAVADSTAAEAAEPQAEIIEPVLAETDILDATPNAPSRKHISMRYFEVVQKLVKANEKWMKYGQFDDMPQCKEGVEEFNALRDSVDQKKPGFWTKLGYKIARPFIPWAYEVDRAGTITTLVVETIIAQHIPVLFKHYERWSAREDDRARAAKNPDGVTPSGGLNDTLPHTDETETDSTSGDSQDENDQKGYYKSLQPAAAVVRTPAGNSRIETLDGKVAGYNEEDQSGIGISVDPFGNIYRFQINIPIRGRK